MSLDEQNIPPRDRKLPAADTGNASNPSPDNTQQKEGEQLLNKKAEKYLREAANIEDLPDAEEKQDMDETLKEESRK